MKLKDTFMPTGRIKLMKHELNKALRLLERFSEVEQDIIVAGPKHISYDMVMEKIKDEPPIDRLCLEIWLKNARGDN